MHSRYFAQLWLQRQKKNKEQQRQQQPIGRPQKCTKDVIWNGFFLNFFFFEVILFDLSVWRLRGSHQVSGDNCGSSSAVLTLKKKSFFLFKEKKIEEPEVGRNFFYFFLFSIWLQSRLEKRENVLFCIFLVVSWKNRVMIRRNGGQSARIDRPFIHWSVRSFIRSRKSLEASLFFFAGNLNSSFFFIVISLFFFWSHAKEVR